LNDSAVLTVSEITGQIRSVIEGSLLLSNVSVKGELSGFVRAGSGHLYFSLKDQGAVINCIMFSSAASKITFKPENGQNIEVRGKIGLFDKRGTYQLYCYSMKPEGLGDIYLAFIKLKEKLEKEGLFDRKNKKPLLSTPGRVGVITSLTGAAARDFFKISRRRDPGLDIVFADALMQGEKAASSVIEALKGLEQLHLDVIIITRGGGSYEELMPFNDEAMARAVFGCPIPVVAAIGHETDTVIVELAADLRAPTPSAAAEMVSPDRMEMVKRYEDRKNRLKRSLIHILQMKSSELRRFDISSMGMRLERKIQQHVQETDLFVHRLKGAMMQKFQHLGSSLEKQDSLLTKLNPARLLSRGFAWIEKPLLKTAVTECSDVSVNDIIRVRLSNGDLMCHVDEIIKKKNLKEI
jgi:exodeoxyribonuclease VII large subunit